MWPFDRRWFYTKASQFAPVMVRMVVGRPVWPERDAAKLALEGYIRNVIGYGCVRMVAEAAASVPLCLYDGENEVDEHELLDLLERPNPTQSGDDLFVAALSFLQISGNLYYERVEGLGGKTGELYTLRPDRMQVEPGPDGWPQAYIYSVNSLKKRVQVDLYKPEKNFILHQRVFHPLSDWYGLSPLEPAAFAIDSHTGAAAFNKALLDNSATPSGAIVVEKDAEGDASLTPEQRTQLQADIDARFVGKRNAGRPMLLEGGLKWQPMGLNMREMQFNESKNDAARDICRALGVPPMLMGIPGDNTYSNYKEANTALWKHTVIPLVKRHACALSYWLGPLYGENYYLEADLDDVDALADERQQQWDRVSNSKILTINEKREALGYEPTDGGDVILVSTSEIPLSDVGMIATGGAADDESIDDSGKPKKKPKPEDDEDEEVDEPKMYSRRRRRKRAKLRVV